MKNRTCFLYFNVRGYLTRLLHFSSRLCVNIQRMFSVLNAGLVLLKHFKGDAAATHYRRRWRRLRSALRSRSCVMTNELHTVCLMQ